MDHDPRENVLIQSPPELRALIPDSKSWLFRGKDEGLPIGNLTSQFGANVYLNDLDHWIVRKLKPMGYLRYMDDLTLFDTNPEVLRSMMEPIDQWLRNNRNQILNPSKTRLAPLKEGINYLGYRIIQSDSPKNPARIHSTPKRKWDFISDLKTLERRGLPDQVFVHPLSPVLNQKPALNRLASINSRLGLLKHADSYRFKTKALAKLKEKTETGDLTLSENGSHYSSWNAIRIKRDFSSVKIR